MNPEPHTSRALNPGPALTPSRVPAPEPHTP